MIDETPYRSMIIILKMGTLVIATLTAISIKISPDIVKVMIF